MLSSQQSTAATSAAAVSATMSAETSFSSPNRLSQMMLPSTADNSNSELMVTRSQTGHFYSDHNVTATTRHQSSVSRNPNAAVFEDYDDDLNLSSELDASFGEKGRVHPQPHSVSYTHCPSLYAELKHCEPVVWQQVERDWGSPAAAAATLQSCWV